ncbi:MAG: cupin domain-containing protein [Bacteroidota bacterium]
MNVVPVVLAIVFWGVSSTVAQTVPGSLQTVRHLSIDSCVNQFTPSHVESTKVGYQYWFADKSFLDGRTLKLSVVAPHQATHPPHAHAEDEFFFILEGTAEFFLAGETRVVHPYASCYAPPNIEHGIRNVGDGILKYLVIKKYEIH